MKPVRIRAWAVVDKKSGMPFCDARGQYYVWDKRYQAENECRYFAYTEEPRRVTIIVEGKK